MKQPPGFEDPQYPNRVWKLQKGIYGLKQGGRQWNFKIDDWFLLDLHFTKSNIDSCLYFKAMEDGSTLFIGLYVDDILAIGLHKWTAWFSQQLLGRFDSKDLGELETFLGMQVVRDRAKQLILIHQNNYCLSVLKAFKMDECVPVDTPLAAEVLTSDMCPSNDEEKLDMSKVPYREAVGCLNYLTVCTRPDIAVAVSSVSAFVERPGRQHWSAVKRILRYLKGTSSFGIVFGGEPSDQTHLHLSAFVDASYADQEDMKSTVGYVTQVEGGPLQWKTKRTGKIATSTTEAEYVGQTYCAKELVSERMLLESVGQTQTAPTVLYGDNEAALKLATKEGLSDLTKHIRVRYHFIRETIRDGEINLKHVSSVNNVADILTKGLTMRDRFARLRLMLGMATPESLGTIVEDLVQAKLEVKKVPTEVSSLSRKGFVVHKLGFNKSVPVPINQHLAQKQAGLRREAKVSPARESVEL